MDVDVGLTAEAGIVAWQEALEDPRDALERIRVIMAEHIAERFQSQSDPWGTLWAPWSPTTVAIRVHRGKDLVRGPFGARARVTDGGRDLVIGFGRNPIPRYFHFGNPSNKVFGKGDGPIPARPLLPITEAGVVLPSELHDAVMKAFSEGIRDSVDEAR